MGKPIIPVQTYMRKVLEEHRDPDTDEINATTLAEDACQHFDLWKAGPNFEIPEWVFDFAYFAAERALRAEDLVSMRRGLRHLSMVGQGGNYRTGMGI